MKFTTDPSGIILRHSGGNVYLHSVPKTAAGTVVIPGAVTHIPTNSLRGNCKITAVEIPKGVMQIAVNEFHYCLGLEKIVVSPDNPCYSSDKRGALLTKDGKWLLRVPRKLSGIYTVPNGVEIIDKDALKGCDKITTLMLSQTVKSISKGAFQGCSSLLHITVRKNVEHIGDGAFADCSRLCGFTAASDSPWFVSDGSGVLYSRDMTRLICAPNALQGIYTVADGVKTVGNQAFSGCSALTELRLPDSVRFIGSRAFEKCENMRFLRLPTNLSRLREGAFAHCTSLAALALPEGLKRLEHHTFRDCTGLLRAQIPGGMEYVAPSAFDGCSALESITVSPDNPNYANDSSGALLDKARQRVLRVPLALRGRYILPDTVESAYPDAFSGCEGITGVVAPMGSVALAAAALGCKNLENAYLKDPAGIVYHYPSFEIYRVWKEITCCRLADAVPAVGDRAFANRQKLTEVEIPGVDTKLGSGVFRGCPNLKKITVNGQNKHLISDADGSLSRRVGRNVVLSWVPPQSKGSYRVPEYVTHIDAFAFENCGDLSAVIVKANVWGIMDDAFAGCPGLTLQGAAGSVAEDHARKKGIPFKPE